METAVTLQDRLYTLGYAFLLALLMIIPAYRLGFFRLPPDRLRPAPPVLFRDLFGVFLVFVTVEVVLVPLGAYIWFTWGTDGFLSGQFLLTPAQQGWLTVIAIAATAVCLYIFLVGLGKPVFRSIGLTNCSFAGVWEHIFIGALTWLICYPLVVVVDNALAMLITWLVPFPPAEQVAVQHLRMSMRDPWLFGVMIFLIVGLVPIIEEILFRGFLQGWLRVFLGPSAAIFSTSLLFALFHYSDSQGVGNIELLCSLFLLSCFLGFLYERQGCLWASIALHMTFNTISVGMILFHPA